MDRDMVRRWGGSDMLAIHRISSAMFLAIDRLSRDPFDKLYLAGRTTPRGTGAESSQAEPSRAEPHFSRERLQPWESPVQCQEHASHTDLVLIQRIARRDRPIDAFVLPQSPFARFAPSERSVARHFLTRAVAALVFLLTPCHAELRKHRFCERVTWRSPSPSSFEESLTYRTIVCDVDSSSLSIISRVLSTIESFIND